MFFLVWQSYFSPKMPTCVEWCISSSKKSQRLQRLTRYTWQELMGNDFQNCCIDVLGYYCYSKSNKGYELRSGSIPGKCFASALSNHWCTFASKLKSYCLYLMLSLGIHVECDWKIHKTGHWSPTTILKNIWFIGRNCRRLSTEMQLWPARLLFRVCIWFKIIQRLFDDGWMRSRKPSIHLTKWYNIMVSAYYTRSVATINWLFPRY